MKICKWMLLFSLALPVPDARADSLKELLMPKADAVKLSDSEADAAWARVAEAFHRNDMEKAVELGRAFLAGDHKASAYQLLGVKVMLGLAGGTDGAAAFTNRQDQEEKKRLEKERAEITDRYQELTAIYRDADARINQLTMNRTRPVQQGSTNHLECLRCARLMDEAKAEMDAMKRPIEENKRKMAKLDEKSNSSLKPQTLELLDMLVAAGEMEAAFAIANTYIRTVGEDLEVAKKQQDVVRLREVFEKAGKVATLLESEIKELVERKHYWQAREKTAQFVSRVEQMNNDPDLLRMVKAKLALDPLGVERRIRSGDETQRLILQHTTVNFAQAFLELETFKTEYPDHPGLKELELHIAAAKVHSMDRVLTQLDQDYLYLQSRFDPVKLRAFASESSHAAGLAVGGSEKLVELGLAPADIGLVQARLQGMNAAMSVVEKIGVPPDRMVRLVEIKTTLTALSVLVQ